MLSEPTVHLFSANRLMIDGDSSLHLWPEAISNVQALPTKKDKMRTSGENLHQSLQELGIDPLNCPGPGPDWDHHAPLQDGDFGFGDKLQVLSRPTVSHHLCHFATIWGYYN